MGKKKVKLIKKKKKKKKTKTSLKPFFQTFSLLPNKSALQCQVFHEGGGGHGVIA